MRAKRTFQERFTRDSLHSAAPQSGLLLFLCLTIVVMLAIVLMLAITLLMLLLPLGLEVEVHAPLAAPAPRSVSAPLRGRDQGAGVCGGRVQSPGGVDPRPPHPAQLGQPQPDEVPVLVVVQRLLDHVELPVLPRVIPDP